MSKFEKRQQKQAEGKQKGSSVEEMARLNVPTGDDFFDSEPKQ